MARCTVQWKKRFMIYLLTCYFKTTKFYENSLKSGRWKYDKKWNNFYNILFRLIRVHTVKFEEKIYFVVFLKSKGGSGKWYGTFAPLSAKAEIWPTNVFLFCLQRKHTFRSKFYLPLVVLIILNQELNCEKIETIPHLSLSLTITIRNTSWESFCRLLLQLWLYR